MLFPVTVLLYEKTREICYKLDNILQRRDRKKITRDMVKEVKKNDKEMEKIDLDIPVDDLTLNFTRLWKILKDMMKDNWISQNSINLIRNY